MRSLALVLVLVLVPASLMAEEEPVAAASFPASWEGAWKGTAEVIRDGKQAMQFAMEPPRRAARGGGGRTWKIVYGEGDTLTVTLTTFGAKPARMTGGEGRVPAVASYALRAVQRARLAR